MPPTPGCGHALIVIDLQEAATAGGRQHALEDVLARIERLAGEVRVSGGRVVFIQHDGPPGDPWEPGTPGWMITSALTRHPDDLVIRKTLNDAFHGTSLQRELDRILPGKVIICGWATDFCVDGTVRSAVARGFDVWVASDCHTLDDRPHLDATEVIAHHNWVWQNLIAPGSVTVLTAAEIAAQLRTPDRLFVYGSLRPGEKNAHLLADIEGAWSRGSVRGHLRDGGWGAGIGYPAIVLADDGDVVEGDVFTSPEISAWWKSLDDFEGDEYRRTRTEVLLEDGSSAEAYVYVLRQE